MSTKISELTSATISGTQEIPVNDAGTTKKVTLASTLTRISTAESDIATLQSDMTTAQSDIAAAESDITTLQSQVSGFQPRTPLDQSSWAWTNQGSATVSQGSNVVRLYSPNSAGEQLRIRSVAAPSTPYTITSMIAPNPMFAVDFQLGGLCLQESSSGKVVSAMYQTRTNNANSFIWRKNTSPTLISSGSGTSTLGHVLNMYLRMADNGTNITLSYSLDGVTFTTLLTEARGTFFTTGPDKVGIVLLNFSSGSEMGMSFLSWDQA